MRSYLPVRWRVLLRVGAIIATGAAVGAARGRQLSAEPPLPTGKLLTPQGKQTEVGSFPANMALSPDGKWIVVTDTGAREFLSVLDSTTGLLVSQLAVEGGSGRSKAALYAGLAFGPTGTSGVNTLYVSHGPEDRVAVCTIGSDGKLTDTGRSLNDPSSLPDAAKSARPNFLAGIALSSDATRCYAAHNETSAYTDYKGSVGILDTATNRVLGRVTVPAFPYALAAVTQGPNADRKVYVASERDGVVSVLDVVKPSAPLLAKNIRVGDHPMALLLDRTQGRLYVANAGSDSLTVIDTSSDRAVRTLPLRPLGGSSLPGMTPTGLTLSPDETRLYVTLGDWNAVAVIDLGKSSIAGYIPVGWYPTSVLVSRDGARLFVANAKGEHSRNPNKPRELLGGRRDTYIENIIEGTVSMLPVPTAESLRMGTAQTLANNRLLPSGKPAEDPALATLRNIGIRHVIYIIKENRTYDQVLGDMPQGNGDPSLTLFGRAVTPNQHALAERFGLFDNFYDCAEVSADGWNWSTSGMTSEYTARNVHFNYSGRGRDYDFEGATNGSPVDLLGMPDVAEAPGGYIWDQCRKSGLTYRAYGFFSAFADLKDAKGKLLVAANAPLRKALVGHMDESYLRFVMAYPDSEASKRHGVTAPGQLAKFGKFDAPSRYSEWKREFDEFVKDGSLPRFEMIRLPCDHTSGTTPGSRSPRAMVADNDYAVGQLVEAVSRSPYWKDTAIFILEDDAQDGQDHVDAHRSTTFVISSHLQHGVIDHHFYNTDSVLHTMEALLGLPPMNQYVATAPLFAGFGPAPIGAEPYSAILPAKEIISEVNQATAYRAKESSRLDFSQADRVPDGILNDILWHSIKGAKAPMPASRHLFRPNAKAPASDKD